MYVLALDTSSPAVTTSIVLVQHTKSGPDVTVAVERAPLAARGHGELLSPSIAECLDDAGVSPREIGAVVAGLGPGPFTGLRVGLVTAAAFADAIGVPTYGVCSLDAIGLACADEPDLLVATDARRREIYHAHYRRGQRVGEPEVSRPNAVDLHGITAIAGAGGELHQDAWPQLRRRTERYPDPVTLVTLALGRILECAASEPLDPLYLRRPDAVVPGAPKAVSQT